MSNADGFYPDQLPPMSGDLDAEIATSPVATDSIGQAQEYAELLEGLADEDFAVGEAVTSGNEVARQAGIRALHETVELLFDDDDIIKTRHRRSARDPGAEPIKMIQVRGQAIDDKGLTGTVDIARPAASADGGVPTYQIVLTHPDRGRTFLSSSLTELRLRYEDMAIPADLLVADAVRTVLDNTEWERKSQDPAKDFGQS